VFLERFFTGEELNKDFENARVRIIPKARGKEIKSERDGK